MLFKVYSKHEPMDQIFVMQKLFMTDVITISFISKSVNHDNYFNTCGQIGQWRSSGSVLIIFNMYWNVRFIHPNKAEECIHKTILLAQKVSRGLWMFNEKASQAIRTWGTSSSDPTQNEPQDQKHM